MKKKFLFLAGLLLAMVCRAQVLEVKGDFHLILSPITGEKVWQHAYFSEKGSPKLVGCWISGEGEVVPFSWYSGSKRAVHTAYRALINLKYFEVKGDSTQGVYFSKRGGYEEQVMYPDNLLALELIQELAHSPKHTKVKALALGERYLKLRINKRCRSAIRETLLFAEDML